LRWDLPNFFAWACLELWSSQSQLPTCLGVTDAHHCIQLQMLTSWDVHNRLPAMIGDGNHHKLCTRLLIA
jgi:hypothetical protein